MQRTITLSAAEHTVVMQAAAEEAAAWAEHALRDLQALAESSIADPEHVADVVHTARMACLRLTAFASVADPVPDDEDPFSVQDLRGERDDEARAAVR